MTQTSFDLSIDNLTISPPPPTQRIPLIPLTINLPEKWFGKRTNQRKLLDHVSLQCPKGQVLAIIGGSGSGKTTLLSAVAGRIANLHVEDGSVSFIPIPSSSSATSSDVTPSLEPFTSVSKGHVKRGVSKLVGYVKQDPRLLEYLTVRETLQTAAALRLPTGAPKSRVDDIVEQTLKELGLEDSADTLVGSEDGRGWRKKGISGGERRRLSIGSVMVTRPSVLVLDEPTTGLDAFSSFQLLETLSQLARRGKTIILSIHQPRSEAFALFDRLAVLSKGSLVYSGPTKEMISYFKDVGYAPSHGKVNPLDWVIDVSSVDTREDEKERESRERVEKLKELWRTRDDTKTNNTPVVPQQEKLNEKQPHDDETNLSEDDTSTTEKVAMSQGKVASRIQTVEKGTLADEDDSEDYFNDLMRRTTTKDDSEAVVGQRPKFWRQTLVLTRRAVINVSRNYGLSIGFLVQTIVMALTIGLAFFRSPENPAGIQSVKTLCYLYVVFNYYLLLMVFTFVLCTELVVFDYEREDGLYGVLPYMTSIFIAYLPVNIISPIVYALIVYFMTGLRTDSLAKHLFSFIANAILQQIASFMFGLLSAGTSRVFARASLVGNSSSIALLLTAGYILIDIPVYIKWARWLSPYYYGFHWAAVIQFKDRVFACEGITGPAANQCVGNNVLMGLKFNSSIPEYAWPLGILAICIAMFGGSFVLLQFYHPGGVTHARARYSDESELKRAEKTSLQELERQQTKEGVKVTIESLRLSVTQESFLQRKTHEEKVIINECFGEFPPGKVTAVMGPSGAGKSTLLQVIAGQLHQGAGSKWRCEGSIKFNDRDADDHRSFCGFVEQSDKHLLPALTVRETLRYAAILKLRDMDPRQKAARAERVLRLLGLKECADNLVGGELVKGISGGEKRRLSLGIQLLSDPPIIVADEPLSGLDSFIARNIMETLAALARSGRTVIISIHQPRSDIWDVFDSLLLLAKGGKTVYWGPKDGAFPLFSSIGLECPQDYNPADFLIDAVSINKRTVQEEHRTSKRLSQMLDKWNEHASFASKTVEKQPTNSTVITQQAKPAAMRYALPTVISRSWKNMRRQPDVFPVRVVNPPFLALLYWFFFQRLSLGPTGAQDRIGLLQQNSALQFVGMLASMAIYPNERNLFFYEWSTTSRYSEETFLLSYTVIELPFQIIAGLLFSIVFVYGVGLQQSPRIFFEFFVSCWGLLSMGESIGIVFATFVENGGLSVSLVSSALSAMAVISGIVSANVPKWLQGLAWVVVIKTSSRIQIINEMVGIKFRCTEEEIQSGQCIAVTGEQILDTLSIKDRNTEKFVGIMLAIVIGYRFLALLALKIKVRYL